MPSLDVVGLGAIYTDKIFFAEDLSRDNKSRISSSAVSPSGSAVNTIVALNKLGIKCGLIGVTGNDKFGLDMTAQLKASGIDISHIQHIDKASSDFNLIFRKPNTNPVYFTCRDAGTKWKIYDHILVKLMAASIIYVSGIINKSQLSVISRYIECSNCHYKLSLSISDQESMFGIEHYESLIRQAEIIFLSKYAIERLTGKKYKESIDILRKLGAKTVVVFLFCGEACKKINKKGIAAAMTAYIRNHEYECLIESAVRKWPNIVENTGVQDAFAAGFLLGYLNNFTIDRCGFLGDIMAQFCFKKTGARNCIPGACELMARYFQIYQEELRL